MDNERIIQKSLAVFLCVIGALIGYQVSQALLSLIPEKLVEIANTTFLIPYKKLGLTMLGIVLCAGFGVLLAPIMMKIINIMVMFFDGAARDASWDEITSGLTGLVVGLVVANLLTAPFWLMPFGGYFAILINITLGIVGGRMFLRQQRKQPGGLIVRANEYRSSEFGSRKILDSSVAIDARIVDIARTGFISGVIIIPQVVLLELQTIADSTDPMRRARGRRGLDAVNGLQQLDEFFRVEIAPETLQELGVSSVDSALLAIAKRRDAVVLTTDYNLSKIAQIQSVRVFNINDLVNAVKPLLIPGDLIEIDVIREGKEPNQGVGYLDDGTMLVVEDGEIWVGKRLEVMVTSMLQTSAGRMVFGRYRREVRPL